MTNVIHIPTLMIASITISLTSAIAIAVVGFRRNRYQILWAAGLLTMAASYSLFILRGQISDWLSIVVGNIFLVLCYTLLSLGIFHFQGRRPQYGLIWAPVAAITLIFPLLIDNVAQRIITIGLIGALQAFYCTFILWQQQQKTAGRGQYLVLSGFAIVALIYLSRLLTTLTGTDPTQSVIDSSWLNITSFLFSLVSLILSSVGLILMTQEQAEQQLQKHRDHLEEMVTSRTQELEITRDLAVSANRAKSSFLANMSHELRTPMHGVLGMISLARRRCENTKASEQLSIAQNSAEHLLRLLNDVLALSKIDADRITLKCQPFHLNKILIRVNRLLRPVVEQKGLAFQIDYPPVLGERLLYGDPSRLSQILMYLTDNAIKFTRTGSIHVTASVAEETAERVHLRFEIRDTGIGIAPDAQRRLFTAFEQADNSSTRPYGGSGLGLVISKRLTEMMNGEIGVNSTPGEGSLFWFTAQLQKN